MDINNFIIIRNVYLFRKQRLLLNVCGLNISLLKHKNIPNYFKKFLLVENENTMKINNSFNMFTLYLLYILLSFLDLTIGIIV